MCQILNRVTSESGSFKRVISLLLPGLEFVGHYPIVTALTGIVINLCTHTSGKS